MASEAAVGEPVAAIDTIKSRGRRGAAVRLVLASGDITSLPSDAPREDLIVISCVPHSYVATANSVVGALSRIGINVAELALDKQEDLRETTFCWISKPLPDSAPYKQLLCLETRFTDAQTIVSNVFRSIIALAPEARRVIMPVLMSGGGGGREQRDVLEGTVRAFHAWTRRGLTLEQLTVVTFREDAYLAEKFTALKKVFGDPSQDEVKVGPSDPSKSVVGLYRSKKDKKVWQAKEKEKQMEKDKQQRRRSFGVSKEARARRKKLLKDVSTKKMPAKMYDDDDEEEVVAEAMADLPPPKPAAAARPVLPAGNAAAAFGSSFTGSSAAAPSRSASLRGLLGLQKQAPQPQPDLIVAISYAEADAPLFALCKTILTLDNPQLAVVELRGAKKSRPDFDLEATERVIGDADAVVAILTPDFLATAACLDHFNVALYAGEGLLVPVLARAAPLPRYMTLVQYLDAQPGNFRRLFPACMAVLNAADPGTAAAAAEWKDASEQRQQLTAEKALALAAANQRATGAKTYDVFISYSQRFARQAQAAAELLRHLLPGVRIFIDTVQLRVGGKWQKTLYDALDSSRTILTLLSPAYFTSLFCKDELAIAKLIHDEGRGQLFALRAVPFDEDACPAFLQALLRDSEPLYACCERLIAALEAGAGAEEPQLLRSVSGATHGRKTERLRDASALLEQLRAAPETAQEAQAAAPIVALVAHVSDAQTASALADAVTQAEGFNGEVVPLLFGGKDELLANRSKEDEALLEQSAIILPLLSDAFVADAGAMNALHTAILRNRQEARCLVPVIAGDSLDEAATPSFVRLLPAVALERAEGGLKALAGDVAAAATLAALGKLEDDDALPIHHV